MKKILLSVFMLAGSIFGLQASDVRNRPVNHDYAATHGRNTEQIYSVTGGARITPAEVLNALPGEEKPNITPAQQQVQANVKKDILEFLNALYAVENKAKQELEKLDYEANASR